MNEIEFSVYDNCHIVFRLDDGNELSGVVMSPPSIPNNKKPRTIYIFIPTGNLKAWKIAELEKDNEKMLKLQKEIDIESITWVKKLS